MGDKELKIKCAENEKKREEEEEDCRGQRLKKNSRLKLENDFREWPPVTYSMQKNSQNFTSVGGNMPRVELRNTGKFYPPESCNN